MGFDYDIGETLDLVAIDEQRNIRRRYQLVATRDLFGHIVVERSWGRIGAKGGSQCASFVDEADARRFIQAVLRRRAGAPKRLGVAYRTRTCS